MKAFFALLFISFTGHFANGMIFDPHGGWQANAVFALAGTLFSVILYFIFWPVRVAWLGALLATLCFASFLSYLYISGLNPVTISTHDLPLWRKLIEPTAALAIVTTLIGQYTGRILR